MAPAAPAIVLANELPESRDADRTWCSHRACLTATAAMTDATPIDRRERRMR
jgi:hypothetical protein